VCVFHQNDIGDHEIVLNSLTIEVRPQIKLLGLIFDKKLYWYPQAMTAIEKANKSQLK